VKINPKLQYDRPTAEELGAINDVLPDAGQKIFDRLTRRFVLNLGQLLMDQGFFVEFDRQLREVYWLSSRIGGPFNRCGVLAYIGGRGPWIPRIHVNDTPIVWRAPSREMTKRMGGLQSFQGGDLRPVMSTWRLELSSLPTELLDISEWLTKLAIANGNPNNGPQPPAGAPHGLKFQSRTDSYHWTPAAWTVAGEWQKKESARLEYLAQLREARRLKQTGGQS